ncbi:uncharacterized protein LOC117640742 isoform X2 [Thrips palmi]|uniref:Uncharacterized protein LOC117640742 isoform X2 n=1 Tax=Thrips palmi TaxID=161013 RepID=A0A6P8Y1W3_THRPL|nr:uncharacterized protein LOC117640742 isoform X2 [Thrips palmi]
MDWDLSRETSRFATSTFTEPVSDNFALVACLEALDLERPRVAWWCMDCQCTASTECTEEHSVRRPKAALRRGLQDWMPAAMQDLQGLQDGLQGLQDGSALTALRLLRGVPATCKVTLRQDDGEAFGAEWRVDGQEHAEDSLPRTLVVALAASGHLQQVPREVQQERAAAAQQPAEQRIDELNMFSLTHSVRSSAPDERRDAQAETLCRVRQHGVRRMTGVYCAYDRAWSLDLLRSAAATLEELKACDLLEDHMVVVHCMPRLRRLHLQGYSSAQPPLLPALPQPSSVQWLLVCCFPRAITQSLLQAHAASLDVVLLAVSASPGLLWSDGCSDLDAVLGPCGLRLSRLVLLRDHDTDRDAFCRDQVAAARRVLPGCTVQCRQCDGVRQVLF